MQPRTFGLGPCNCCRMIFDSKIDDRTTADRVLLRIQGMKPKFDVADIKPNESIVDRHTVEWTFKQIRPPRTDHYGLFGKDHHCSHYRWHVKTL